MKCSPLLKPIGGSGGCSGGDGLDSNISGSGGAAGVGDACFHGCHGAKCSSFICLCRAGVNHGGNIFTIKAQVHKHTLSRQESEIRLNSVWREIGFFWFRMKKEKRQ